VTTASSNNPKDIEQFLTLLHATAQRDGITVHADRYYRTMAETLCAETFLTIFLARLGDDVLAANLMFRYGDTVIYAHGASGNAHRNVMAPHLLQWKQIEWAREGEFHWYDFWGLAPHDADATHPWAGITRFKRGFGGEARVYLPAMEKSLNGARYALVRLRRRLR